jgi:glycosyltransferase involved in cell wall biosynthesis
MKTLFIGMLYRVENFEEINKASKSGMEIASDKYQKNFIEGLYNNDISCDVVSSISVGSYPLNYSKLFIKGSYFFDSSGTCYSEIGFINFYVFKGISRFLNMLIPLFKWLKSINKIEGGIVYVYSLYLPYLIIMLLFKIGMFRKNIKYCLIVPDLYGKYAIVPPIFSVKGVYHRIESFFLSILIRCPDYFVLFTDQMKEATKSYNSNSVVIEGLISDRQIKLYEANDVLSPADKFIFLYTGSLLPQFGISTFIDALLSIGRSDVELWICGPHKESLYLREVLESNKIIKYLGFLNENEIVKVQKQATVLVNPRPNIGNYVRFSFPSKTMEYMLSGTPILMFELDGLPNEYKDLMYFFDNYNVPSMSNIINFVCSLDRAELENTGLKAKSFVVNQKNSGYQVKKLLKLIKV